MKKRLTIIVAVLVVFFPFFLMAQSADEIAKQLNTELRNAQSAFFNQKFDLSQSRIDKCAELVESLKKIDSGHKQLKSFEQRLEKLKKDLARKTAKNDKDVVSAKQPQASRPASAAKNASGDKAKRLPRKTAQEIKELNRTMDSLERFEKGRMDRLAQGENPERVESILGEISGKANGLDEMLAKVKAAAAEEGALEHPEYLDAEERAGMVRAWALTEIENTRKKVAELTAGQAKADAASLHLKKLWEENDNKFFTPINNLSYENSMEKIGEAFKLLNEFNQNKGKILREIEEFETSYGKTSEEIEKNTGGMEAVYPWENFKKAFENMDKIPTRLAEKINGMISSEIDSLGSRHDFYRLAKHDEIKKMVDFCSQNVADFSAGNEINAKIAADVKKFHEKIDGQEWPASKGSASDQAAALKYFNDTWGKDQKHNYQVLGTVVRGDWSVQKKDLLGQPIMYGLPVLLAVQKPEDKAHGLARVFILTVRTAEAAGVKMAPPFTSDTVGDSYFIKAAKIK